MCHEHATCDFILEARQPSPDDDDAAVIALAETALHRAWADAHRGEVLGPLGLSVVGMCAQHADAEMERYAHHPWLTAAIVPFDDAKSRWPYSCGYDAEHFMEHLEARERVHALNALTQGAYTPQHGDEE